MFQTRKTFSLDIPSTKRGPSLRLYLEYSYLDGYKQRWFWPDYGLKPAEMWHQAVVSNVVSCLKRWVWHWNVNIKRFGSNQTSPQRQLVTGLLLIRSLVKHFNWHSLARKFTDHHLVLTYLTSCDGTLLLHRQCFDHPNWCRTFISTSFVNLGLHPQGKVAGRRNPMWCWRSRQDVKHFTGQTSSKSVYGLKDRETIWLVVLILHSLELT